MFNGHPNWFNADGNWWLEILIRVLKLEMQLIPNPTQTPPLKVDIHLYAFLLCVFQTHNFNTT